MSIEALNSRMIPAGAAPPNGLAINARRMSARNGRLDLNDKKVASTTEENSVNNRRMTARQLDDSLNTRRLAAATAAAATAAIEPEKSEKDPAGTEKLTEQTRKWVSMTFFGTMLKQMRESPFKSDLFSGGRGGQAFGSVLDQHLAERMGGAVGEKIVRSIVRRFDAAQKRPNDLFDKQQPAPSSKNPTGYDYSKVRIHVAPALRG